MHQTICHFCGVPSTFTLLPCFPSVHCNQSSPGFLVLGPWSWVFGPGLLGPWSWVFGPLAVYLDSAFRSVSVFLGLCPRLIPWSTCHAILENSMTCRPPDQARSCFGAHRLPCFLILLVLGYLVY